VQQTNHGTRHFCEIARREGLLEQSAGLIAGCGRGREALYLQRTLGAKITGIDINLRLDAQVEREVSRRLQFLQADVLQLPFETDSFDFVFFHHVLEHVSDPVRSLEELSRVLRPHGWMYIGTPNRHRILGYLGAYGVSAREQIRWNLMDYVDRIRGRFRNELGAHAGFSERELREMLGRYFTEVRWLTRSYLRFKYAGHIPSPLLRIVLSRPLISITAPAHYALCRK
jgi:SAM-dependent methyltransferase